MSVIGAFQKMSVDDLRSEVIDQLKGAYSDGRIGVDSLERRLKDATKAEDKESLLGLVADIPAPKSESDGKTYQEEPRPWMINDRVPREHQTFFAVMGGTNRIGRWQPAKNISSLSIMGGVKLDFREAEFPRGGVKINVGCVMGGMEIVVPPGINVDISGIPLLGGMENKAGVGDPDAPTMSVRAVAVMGGVEVKRKEPKNRDSGNGNSSRKKRRK